MSKSATIKDVANLAGVSISTVSHVLNGTASITEATKRRVEKAMKHLHYTPNALARGLRVSKRNLIGIVVPDITNEFYSKFVASLLRNMAKAKVSAIVISTDYNLEREKSGIQSLLMTRVDGMVFLGGAQDENLIDKVSAAKVAVVLADRRYKDYPSVEFNNLAVMQELLGALKAKGYQKVGYISESTVMVNLNDRYEGFKRGVAEQAMEVSRDWLFDENWLRLDKLNSARQLINQTIDKVQNLPTEALPDVLITSSDMIAAGVIDALIRHGFKIPEDIGVVGYDDTTIAQYFQPSLTSVRQDYEQAAGAILAMLNREMNKDHSQRHLVLPNQIIFRSSTR